MDFSFIVLGVLIIGALVWATHARNEVWKDDLLLWISCVKHSPNKARPYNNVGTALMKMRMYNEAAPWIIKAVSLIKGGARNAGFGESHNNLGVLLAKAAGDEPNLEMKRKLFDEAIGHIEKAREYYPYSAEIHNNLGIYYEATGRHDEALKELKEAVRINPYFELAKINLERLTNVRNTNRAP